MHTSTFATDYARLLLDSSAARNIGPAAAWLCIIVATHAGPRQIALYPAELLPIVGLKNLRQLESARAAAVAAGWLDYTPPARADLPALYRATVPPRLSIVAELQKENP